MGKKRKRKSPTESHLDGGESELMPESTVVESVAQFKSNRIVICKTPGCFDMATVGGFCRLHYLSNWKKVKSKEAKSHGKGLEEYLQELATRFPEEYFDKLRAELEEMSSSDSSDSSDDREERSSFYDTEDGDEDMDTIIKGIRVEDF